MRHFHSTIDTGTLARLQAEATQCPAWYRFRIAALSIFGDVMLTATQVIFLALPIALGLLMFRLDHPLYTGAGVLALVLLVWMVRPAFHFDDKALAKADAPALHELVESLRQHLDVPGMPVIVLDDSFNAGALQLRGAFGVFGGGFVLYIGVPLLCGLTREQLSAVISHELGHFSRRHGRFGHYIYRTRQGWSAYADYVTEEDSGFDKGLSAFAKWFVPLFNMRSFVWARQCEFEADADAASVAGALLMAQALVQMAVVGALWRDDLPAALRRLQRDQPQPPAHRLERFRAVIEQAGTERLKLLLNTALAEKSGWLDTHPALAERLAAIGSSVALPLGLFATLRPARCAGEELFGTDWAKTLMHFNQTWQEKAALGWHVQHLRARAGAHLLAVTSETGAALLPVPDRVERALLLSASDAETAAAFEAIQQDHPQNPRVLFELGAALLALDLSRGEALLEECVKRDPAYRVAAYAALLAAHDQAGNTQAARRFEARLERALAHRAQAADAFRAALTAAQINTCALSPAVLQVLAAVAAADPVVAGAAMCSGTQTIDTSKADAARAAITLPLHAFLLRIDPAQMEHARQSEGAVSERYCGYAASLLGPHEIVLAIPYFATETVPSFITSTLAALPAFAKLK